MDTSAMLLENALLQLLLVSAVQHQVSDLTAFAASNAAQINWTNINVVLNARMQRAGDCATGYVCNSNWVCAKPAAVGSVCIGNGECVAFKFVG